MKTDELYAVIYDELSKHDIVTAIAPVAKHVYDRIITYLQSKEEIK